MTARQRDDRDHRHIRLLLSFLLTPGANCVDVGAYQGLVLAEMVRIAPFGRRVAYEPLADRAEVLQRHFPGVDVRQRGVSDATRTAVFYRALDRPPVAGCSRPMETRPKLNHSSCGPNRWMRRWPPGTGRL
jgi:hypothetical protein